MSVASLFRPSGSIKTLFRDVALRFRDSVAETIATNLNADPIHQLRLSARRLEAALVLLQDALPRHEQRWMLRQIKKLRSLSNPIRDLDVLIQWSKAETILERDLRRWKRKRKQCSRTLKSYLEKKLAQKKLDTVLEKLDVPFEETIRFSMAVALQQELTRFWERARDYFLQPSRMHDWRVATKRLRYMIEFTSESQSQSSSQALTALSDLQSRLGQICDAIQRKKYKTLEPLHSLPSSFGERLPSSLGESLPSSLGKRIPNSRLDRDLEIIFTSVNEVVLDLWKRSQGVSPQSPY